MRHKRLKLIVVLLLGLGLTELLAQETIPATGGEAAGSGGSVSYSVGQIVYNTYTGTASSVGQGVQQPFEISEIVGIVEAKGINLTVSTFPNPATDYLSLIIDEFEISNLSFQLFDLNGNLLQNTQISGNVTNIITTNLLPATYFLKVIQGQKVIKKFKITKI